MISKDGTKKEYPLQVKNGQWVAYVESKSDPLTDEQRVANQVAAGVQEMSSICNNPEQLKQLNANLEKARVQAMLDDDHSTGEILSPSREAITEKAHRSEPGTDGTSSPQGQGDSQSSNPAH